jgi:hypothetical protein
VGVLLLLLGVGWLLDALDVLQFPWEVVLPSALILIGVALVLTSRSPGGHAGLLTAGVILSVVLVIGSAIDFPIGGGVGDRVYRPATGAEVRSDYRLGVGQLTLDLGNVPTLEGVDVDRVRARVGIGKLLVIVPDTLPVRIEARAGLGNVQVLGVEASGFEAERVVGPQSITGGEPLDLVLSVGVGQVEVRYG